VPLPARGDIAVPSGLYARLCNAFLVYYEFNSCELQNVLNYDLIENKSVKSTCTTQLKKSLVLSKSNSGSAEVRK